MSHGNWQWNSTWHWALAAFLVAYSSYGGHRVDRARGEHPRRRAVAPLPDRPKPHGPKRPIPGLRPGHGPVEAPDREALRLVNGAARELDCDRVSEAVVRVSNRILESRLVVADPDAPRLERERWQRLHRDPRFWRRLWHRLTEMMESCEANCFEDGLAVGQISGAAYCAVSTELGGLEEPGALEQASLPSCDAAIRTGCIEGYRASVREFEGCHEYATGSFSGVFRQSVSQDCHIEPEELDEELGEIDS